MLETDLGQHVGPGLFREPVSGVVGSWVLSPPSWLPCGVLWKHVSGHKYKTDKWACKKDSCHPLAKLGEVSARSLLVHFCGECGDMWTVGSHGDSLLSVWAGGGTSCWSWVPDYTVLKVLDGCACQVLMPHFNGDRDTCKTFSHVVWNWLISPVERYCFFFFWPCVDRSRWVWRDKEIHEEKGCI